LSSRRLPAWRCVRPCSPTDPAARTTPWHGQASSTRAGQSYALVGACCPKASWRRSGSSATTSKSST
jgi:hypothetical protein